LPDEIQVLENDRARATFTAMNHFQLGCYYLWSGNAAGVKQTEKALGELDAQLLEQFSKLKAQHPKHLPTK
jgi:hypothetical protein